MILKEAIQDVLCGLFYQITGQLFIHANPAPVDDKDTPRPEGLYGSVNIINASKVSNTDYKELINEDGPGVDIREVISGIRRIQVSVNTYRQGAFNIMMQLSNRLQANSSLETLNAACLGFETHSDIRDLTLAVGPGLEERYQMDLFLYTEATDEEIILAIESLTIKATLDNGLFSMETEIEVNNS